MVTTFLVTALLDVSLGLQVGLALSIAMLLFSLSSLERKGMGQLHGQYFVPLDRYPEAAERAGIKCYKLTGYLWFGNASKMRDQTYALMAAAAGRDGGGEHITHVVLDFSGSSGLDLTTMLALQYLLAEARKLGVRLVLAECSDGVRHNLRQAGMLEATGGGLTRHCLEEVVALLENDKAEMAAAASAPAGQCGLHSGSNSKGRDLEAGLGAPATGAGGEAEAEAVGANTKAKALALYKRLLSPGGK
jgi:MFS superfamily sulfate permease-like transporter